MKSWVYLLLLLSILGALQSASYNPNECTDYIKTFVDKRSGEVDIPLFVPDDDVKKALLGLIHAERRSIWAALFRLTDKDITQALIAAHNRKVKVVVVVDKSALGGDYEKVSLLVKAGVEVRFFRGSSWVIMHYKLFLFENNLYGKSLAWYGSANATQTGMERNEEYVNVRDKAFIVSKFRQRFVRLWNLPQTKPVTNAILHAAKSFGALIFKIRR